MKITHGLLGESSSDGTKPIQLVAGVILHLCLLSFDPSPIHESLASNRKDHQQACNI